MKESATAGLYKMKVDLFGRDSDTFLRYTMAKELNPRMQLRLFQSGPGTLWTNMGNKNFNLMMPLPANEKASADKGRDDKPVKDTRPKADDR